MLYVFKGGIGTSNCKKYIGGERELSNKEHRAYKYTDSLSDAHFFTSVGDAINWLERVAYRNGELEHCYNGCLSLVRIEAVTPKPEYKEIGTVE